MVPALAVLQLLPLAQAQAQALLAIAWISCATTLNFSNCDRSYNSSRRCSSPSYSRLALAIPNWHK